MMRTVMRNLNLLTTIHSYSVHVAYCYTYIVFVRYDGGDISSGFRVFAQSLEFFRHLAVMARMFSISTYCAQHVLAP